MAVEATNVADKPFEVNVAVSAYTDPTNSTRRATMNLVIILDSSSSVVIAGNVCKKKRGFWKLCWRKVALNRRRLGHVCTLCYNAEKGKVACNLLLNGHVMTSPAVR